MVKKLAGLGFLALLLCSPLQADHEHRRWRHSKRGFYGPGYIEIHVGTPYGYGSFVRGFPPGAPYYRRYRDYGHHGKRHFRKLRHKHHRHFRKHRHRHYDGYCPF